MPASSRSTPAALVEKHQEQLRWTSIHRDPDHPIRIDGVLVTQTSAPLRYHVAQGGHRIYSGYVPYEQRSLTEQ